MALVLTSALSMIAVPLVSDFSWKTNKQKIQQHESAGTDLPEVVLRFRSTSTPDPRRYNAPSSREVAFIFEGDEPPTKRDISVYPLGVN